MWQAAAAATGNGPVPFELWLAQACERWNALPTEILAQPAGLLNKMALVDNVFKSYQSFKKAKPGKGANWKSDHPEMWDLIAEVEGWLPND